MRPDTVTTAEYLLDQRELDLALNLFNDAEAEGADPDRCAAGRWMVFMLSGDFEAAWRESDAIRLRCKPDVHRFWQGEDVKRRRSASFVNSTFDGDDRFITLDEFLIKASAVSVE